VRGPLDRGDRRDELGGGGGQRLGIEGGAEVGVDL
jgi:hypothetical protein